MQKEIFTIIICSLIITGCGATKTEDRQADNQIPQNLDDCQWNTIENSCVIWDNMEKCNQKTVKIDNYICECVDYSDCPPCPWNKVCEACFIGWVCTEE